MRRREGIPSGAPLAQLCEAIRSANRAAQVRRVVV
jgi:hypothetical protein